MKFGSDQSILIETEKETAILTIDKNGKIGIELQE